MSEGWPRFKFAEHLEMLLRRFGRVVDLRKGVSDEGLLGGSGLAVFAVPDRPQEVPAFEKIQSQAELDKAVIALDKALFDSYNKCDLEKFSSFFTENVEFYHDQGGVTLGRAALTESVKKNICGRVTRELVPGTLQVFHMEGYG